MSSVGISQSTPYIEMGLRSGSDIVPSIGLSRVSKRATGSSINKRVMLPLARSSPPNTRKTVSRRRRTLLLERQEFLDSWPLPNAGRTVSRRLTKRQLKRQEVLVLSPSSPVAAGSNCKNACDKTQDVKAILDTSIPAASQPSSSSTNFTEDDLSDLQSNLVEDDLLDQQPNYIEDGLLELRALRFEMLMYEDDWGISIIY